MSETAFYSCRLPAFPRGLVIDKGREGRFHLSISRNGMVLFAEWPFAEFSGEPVVLAVRPWLDRTSGTIVQVRERPPARRPVEPVEARLVPERPLGELRFLALSPRGFLLLEALAPHEIRD